MTNCIPNNKENKEINCLTSALKLNKFCHETFYQLLHHQKESTRHYGIGEINLRRNATAVTTFKI